MIIGTLPYMAPEQLEGRDVDARSDIFAFGAVLYEMVGGRRAFEGEGATLIAAILDRHPPSLAQLRAHVPELLDRVIRRCLEKDPEKRWQTARDLAAALRWSTDAPLPAQVTAVQRSNRPTAAMLVLAVTGMLLTGVAGAWLAQRAETPQTLPPATIRFLIDDPPVAANFAGGLPSVTVARDGSVFVYVGVDGGIQRLYQRRMGDTSPTPIAGTEGAGVPFLSPDGRWVAFTIFGSTANRLRKVSQWRRACHHL